jgi:L-aspartate oxidase
MSDLPVEIHDRPIIVGSGITGLIVALRLTGAVVVTKAEIGAGSSRHAQGGIAAAIGPGDDPAAHAADTIAVGGGLVDAEVASLTTGAAPHMIEWMIANGARFDQSPAGAIDLGREAGHSAGRILHADGDATGGEVIRALIAAVASRPDIDVAEGTEVIDLVRGGNRVAGAVVRSAIGEDRVMLAPAVVLATGGIGGLFAKTTNPSGLIGSGVAAAYRAGARLGDLEFVQFHPTALDVNRDPLPLLTEALRGAGARLIDSDGRRFMPDVHHDAELAPRDIVARAVFRHGNEGGAFLDLSPIADVAMRFPTITAAARSAGLEPAVDALPVTPAAHYHMGGIVTDASGRTSLEGLYAAGEVAVTGLHGANRLASNSLLEGMVFADRVAADIRRRRTVRLPEEVEVPDAPRPGPIDLEAADAARTAMWSGVGVVRDADGIRSSLEVVESLAPVLQCSSRGRDMALVASLVGAAALDRRESRGSHYRSDYPQPASHAEHSRIEAPAVAARSVATRRRRRYVA